MPKAIPERSCVACREPRGKSELLRFVLAPDASVVYDHLQKLPGRGVYTCCKESCVRQAAVKRQFSRGFKCEVRGAEAESLVREVREKLLQHIASYLSLANKGGKVVSGSDQVAEQLKKGGARILFIATDMSADIAEKFKGLAQLKKVPTAALFEKERLGALIGKELRSVLAVLDSGFSGAIGKELEKYRNFREEERD